jgi:hypothetical protein
MPPDGPPGPDAYDVDLSVVRGRVGDLGVGLASWSYRREPDAAARRAASDAIDAIDEATAALGRVRARLITETRRADDEAAVRVDELLARTRGSPRPLTPTGDRQRTPTAPRPKASEGIVGQGDDKSRATP